VRKRVFKECGTGAKTAASSPGLRPVRNDIRRDDAGVVTDDDGEIGGVILSFWRADARESFNLDGGGRLFSF
jgi:hypothetical protein